MKNKPQKNIKSNGVELLTSPEVLLNDYSMSQEVVNRSDRRVAIFGGSSIKPGSTYYEKARFFANNIASNGISVITGGGPGIMEAGNRGACAASQSNQLISYGIRVKAITDEMIRNPYLQKSYEFETLSLRLLSLISSCDVAVLFPGGFGTLEEMFSLLVRIRVKMLKKIPIYLFGQSFWEGLVNWIGKVLVNEGVIDKEDMDYFVLEDNIDELSRQVIQYVLSINNV